MMKQRRMLMSQNDYYLDNLFKSAIYVASVGYDGSDTNSIGISSNLLLSGHKYYLFGYYANSLAIFSFLNGTITKLYEFSGYYTLNVDNNFYPESYYKLSVDGDYTKHSFGLIALEFSTDMDDIFTNIANGIVSGTELIDYRTSRILYFENFASEGLTRYLFAGIANRFCIYKVNGKTFSDLTAVFNHNLYLVSLENESVELCDENLIAIYSYGYTALSIRW